MFDDLFDFDFMIEEDTSIEEGLMDGVKKKIKDKQYKKKYPIEPNIGRKQAISKLDSIFKKILSQPKYSKVKKCIDPALGEDRDDNYDAFLAGEVDEVYLYFYDVWKGYPNARDEEVGVEFGQAFEDFCKDVNKELVKYGLQ